MNEYPSATLELRIGDALVRKLRVTPSQMRRFLAAFRRLEAAIYDDQGRKVSDVDLIDALTALIYHEVETQ